MWLVLLFIILINKCMFFEIDKTMSCCNEKRLDGLQTTGSGVDLSADVEIGGDLTVKGGTLILDPSDEDGYGTIRSSDAAFGLDIEAPVGKRIRLINGDKSWVEIDGNGLELNASLTGQVGLRAPNVATNYEFTLPIDMGSATQVLTSDGTNTYWSTPAGPGGGGTVTSVDIASLTPFITAAGGPITGAGIFGIDLSGVPLDVLHGGTGVTTSTGTGSVVLNTDADLSGSLEAVTDVVPSDDSPWKFINLSSVPVTGNSFAILQPNIPNGTGMQMLLGKDITHGVLMRYLHNDNAGLSALGFIFLGSPPSFILMVEGIRAISSNEGTAVVRGGLGVNLDLNVGEGIVLGGNLDMKGVNSGVVSFKVQPDAGTWDFNVPTSGGNSGQVLTSGGDGGVMTWETRGTVTSVGMVVPAFLTVSGGPITNTGVFTLSYSGTALPVGAGGTGVTTSTGSGSVVLNVDPVFNNSIGIIGSVSGRVNLKVISAGSTWDFIFPNDAGTTGQMLTSQGGGNSMTWSNAVTSVGLTSSNGFLSATGTVTSSGVLTVGLSGSALPVANGGTGVSTSTGIGSVVLNTDPVFVNSIGISGSSSGTITIKTQVDSGTFNFNLPTSAGSSGQVLTSGGAAGVLTWTTPSTSTGTVTSVAMTVPAFLNILGSPVTTSGTLALGLSGTPLPVLNGGTGVTSSTGSGSVVLNNGPTLTGTLTCGTIISTGTQTNQFNTSTGGGTDIIKCVKTDMVDGGFCNLHIGYPGQTVAIGYNLNSTLGNNMIFGFSGQAAAMRMFNVNTNSTSSTTGTLVTSGGIGSGGNISLKGVLRMEGTSSGAVTIQTQAASGTWNFNLPTSAGSSGQVLASAGGGSSAMTWTTVPPGTVTSVGISSGNSFLSVSGGPITTSGTLNVTLSGSALPVAYGGTGTTSSTGSGSVVLQNNPTMSNITMSGVFNGQQLLCTASTPHQIRTNGGPDDVCFFYKQDLNDGGRAYVQIGRQSSTNLAASLAFNRNDGGNGSRFEISIWGKSNGFAVYQAFVNGAEWYNKTCVVDGGIGCSGNMKANNVNVAGNFVVDEGDGGLETHAGNVFRYNKGETEMELYCAGHTIDNLVSSLKWSRMGNVTYVYFDATFDIGDGPDAELIWTNLPSVPLGRACAPMSLQTDLQPGAIFINKTYVVEVDPVIGARFYRTGSTVNQYQRYVNAKVSVQLSGMLTYPSDEMF